MTPEQEFHTLLPQNPEAERGLLSVWMADGRVGALAAEYGLTHEFMHIPSHRIIAADMTEAWRDGKSNDMQSVLARLSAAKTLDAAGGFNDLVYIQNAAPVPSAARGFIGHIVECHRLRRIYALTKRISIESLQKEPSDRLLTDSLAELAEISQVSKSEAPKTFVQMLNDKLDRMTSDEPEEETIKTGIYGIDKHSPMKLGSMPLITGERKAGKSILALTVARQEMHSGHPVLYFSLEDPVQAVIDRLTAAEIGVPIDRHHHTKMNEGEQQRASRFVTDIVALKRNLIIRDRIHDLNGIVATIRQQKAKHPDMRLAVVDYSQLVKVFLKGANREQEVSTISRTFRLLSIELGICIALLCQLNKDGDTRESKALEQDCTAMWKVLYTEDESERNTKRIIAIPFQRNGQGGIAFPVLFQGEFGRILNLAIDPKPDPRITD